MEEQLRRNAHQIALEEARTQLEEYPDYAFIGESFTSLNLISYSGKPIKLTDITDTGIHSTDVIIKDMGTGHIDHHGWTSEGFMRTRYSLIGASYEIGEAVLLNDTDALCLADEIHYSVPKTMPEEHFLPRAVRLLRQKVMESMRGKNHTAPFENEGFSGHRLWLRTESDSLRMALWRLHPSLSLAELGELSPVETQTVSLPLLSDAEPVYDIAVSVAGALTRKRPDSDQAPIGFSGILTNPEAYLRLYLSESGSAVRESPHEQFNSEHVMRLAYLAHMLLPMPPESQVETADDPSQATTRHKQ